MLPLFSRAKLGLGALLSLSSVLCVFVVVGKFAERSRKKKKNNQRSSVDSTSTPEGEVFVLPSLLGVGGVTSGGCGEGGGGGREGGKTNKETK